MEKPFKIFISHQAQCEEEQIEKLLIYLKNAGFVVIHGSLNEQDFVQIVTEIDSYVCILNEDTYKSKAVANEITTAALNGKRIFAIYCPNIKLEITLPTALDNYATAVTEWNPEKLVEGLKGKDIGFSNQIGQKKQDFRSTTPPSCN